MAGFCTKCGRPLPENGVCPCTMQQENAAPQQGYTPPQGYAPQQQGYVPQQQGYDPQQGYTPPQYSTSPSKVGMVLGGSLKNLPNMWVGYFRDPVGTTRLASEKKDYVSGLIMMGLSVIFTLLGTLFFGLIHLNEVTYWEFGDLVLPWLGITFLGPIVAYVITIGLLYILTAIAKMRVDFRSVIAIVGVNSVLPVVLLAVTMLAGMISPIVFEIFAVLLCAAWVIGFFTSVLQVLNIKMNIVNTFVLLLGITVAVYAIVLLLTWFVYGEWSDSLGLRTLLSMLTNA